MRNQPPLQERHLQEAVRQKVITSEQYEGVLAVARAMATAEGTAAPDLGWLAFFNAAVCMLLVGAGAVWVLAQHDRWSPIEVIGASSVLAVASLAATFFAKRFSMGRPARGIFAAGAALYTWGVAAGAYMLAMGHSFNRWADSYGSFSYQMTRVQIDRAYMAGDVATIVASVLAMRFLRAPAAMGSLALAAGHLVMAGAEHTQRMNGGHLSDRDAVPWLIALSVGMCASAFSVERSQKKEHDPAFWLHAVGILPLGVAGLIVVDREAGAALLWIAMAVGAIYLGLKASRRTYLLAGAAALLIFPAYGLDEARAGKEVVGVAFLVSAALVAVAGTVLRRHYLSKPAPTVAPRVADDATVWSV